MHELHILSVIVFIVSSKGISVKRDLMSKLALTTLFTSVKESRNTLTKVRVRDSVRVRREW